MSSDKISFSPLEDRLSSGEAHLVFAECNNAIEALRQRLRAEAAQFQPVARYQRLVSAQLAVEAASEVISALNLSAPQTSMNPYQAGPEFLRKRSS